MTKPEITFSLDLGTTGIKAAAFDERLNCLCHFHVENRLYYPAPGLVEQDPDYMVSLALGLTRRLVDQLGDGARQVTAICCSGQMGGVLGIDAGWNAVTHLDVILDPRSNVTRGQIAPHLDYILQNCGGLTTQLEKMLYWRDHCPLAYARIDKFIAINAYLAGKLAGLGAEAAFTDLSFAGVNGVLSAVSGDWDEALLPRLGIPRQVLPRVVRPEAVVGVLDPGLAGDLGLPPGVQIVAGTGDGAATHAGSGISRQGQALDLSGSACSLGVYSDRFVPDVDKQLFINMKSPIGAGWYVIYVNQFGRTHRWFIDTFCADLAQAEGVDGAYAWADRQAEALEPGSGGMLAAPHLSGRALPPNAHVRGAFLGFGLGYTRAHFYRALLESHAVEFGLACSALKRLYPELELGDVFVSGGGSRSDFWNQMKADVLGSRYYRLVDSDLSTLRGDALIAARARGRELPPDEPALLQFDRDYAPDPAANERYATVVAGYQTLTGGLDPLMAQLFEPDAG